MDFGKIIVNTLAALGGATLLVGIVNGIAQGVEAAVARETAISPHFKA